MAPLPSLTVTGNLKEVLGDVVAGELVESALSRAVAEFTCNVPADSYVKWEGNLKRIDTVYARFDSDGDLVTDEGDPVKLLAQDDGLNVRGLQWRCHVTIPSSVIPPAPSGMMRSFWFNATADETEVKLGEVAPAVASPIQPVENRGPQGFSVDDFTVDAGGNLQFFIQGEEVGVAQQLPASAWNLVANKPTFMGVGATEVAARNAIDAVGGGAAITAGANGQQASISSGKLIAHDPLYINPALPPYNVKFDRYTTLGASMSSTVNPTQLTVVDPTGYTFTLADVGKVIRVTGAGAGGADLKTTIVDAINGKAILASPCLTTVSTPCFAIWGTDNATALNAFFADLSYNSYPRKLSRIGVMPPGCAMYSGTLLLPTRGTLKGSSENWLATDLIYGNGRGFENGQGTILYQIWDQNVDCARVLGPGGTGWFGMLQGFAIEQDRRNTQGNGLCFRTADGTPQIIIDGGNLNRIAVLGVAGIGFEFPAGSLPTTFRDLDAFACGYEYRKDFTANTTSGSTTLSNVSSFTGLAVGDILTGVGIPTDSVIRSLNSGAATMVISAAATATAAGVAVQRLGAPGVKYTPWGPEPVHFDGLSGDQNAGGLLRIEGVPGAFSLGLRPNITITNLKNEYGANVYREPPTSGTPPAWTWPGSAPSVPQGLNAIVLSNLTNAVISIRGLSHWADASSSPGTAPPDQNSLGRAIGAAILDVGNDTAAPDVTWEALGVRLAAGSGQDATTAYAFRDNHVGAGLPILAGVSGKGTNRVKPAAYRTVADANDTFTLHDSTIGWSSITAARLGVLPLLSTVPIGRPYVLRDVSGNASAGRTITAFPSGSDTIVGDSVISLPWSVLTVMSDGTRWIGHVSDITRTGFQTLTNTRITPRVFTATTPSTLTMDSNLLDVQKVTALANAMNIAAITGNPTAGQVIRLSIKDNGTSRALTYDPILRPVGVSLPAATTPGKILYFTLIYNADDTKWDVISVAQEGSRTLTEVSNATPAINTDFYNRHVLSAQAAAITGYTLTGTPNDNDVLTLVITDDGTARAITHSSSLLVAGDYPLATTTVPGQTLVERFRYNSVTAKFECYYNSYNGFPVTSDEISTGEANLERRIAVQNTVATGNGSLRLSYFTAKKTGVISQIRTLSGATAQVGATLVRIGIYSVDSAGNLTLVASTASDTALWSAASTSYTKSLSAAFTKIRGQRYAVGVLVVGSSTAPSLNGAFSIFNVEGGVAPRIGGLSTGQTDLPSSLAPGSIFDSQHLPYAALLP